MKDFNKTVKLDGAGKAFKELRKAIAKHADKINKSERVGLALISSALAIVGYAKKKISEGSRTGRIYEWEVDLPGAKGDKDKVDMWMKMPNGRVLPMKKRAKPHRASAPGEYPKKDKGTLTGKITHDPTNPKEAAAAGMVQVGVADYKVGFWLEEGTRYMKARPWLAPSVKANEEKFIDIMYKTISELS